MQIMPSPTELSQAAGISISYASEILAGKRRPSAALARLIEEKAGIPRHLLRPDIFDAPAEAEAGGDAAGCAPAPAGETPPAEPVDQDTSGFDRFAGRTVQCALCERRLSETTVRACQAPDCPHADREAA